MQAYITVSSVSLHILNALV